MHSSRLCLARACCAFFFSTHALALSDALSDRASFRSGVATAALPPTDWVGEKLFDRSIACGTVYLLYVFCVGIDGLVGERSVEEPLDFRIACGVVE